ncbi:MAG: S41 family peptidase, partial [Pseudomonadota bacterium]
MAHSPQPSAPKPGSGSAPTMAADGKPRAKAVFTRGQTALLMGAALIAGAIVSGGFARPKFTAEYFTNINLFGRIYEEVHQNYVTVPNDKDLIKGSIDGMLSTLDPHSSYLPADDYKTMQEQTQGSFAGLGIQVQMPNEGPDKGYVLIVAPIDDTPAARAGLQTNDLITEIDGDPVQGKTIDEAIAQMKGERGTAVELTILRDRDAPTFKVPLVRDIVRINPVSSRAEGNFGYIRVSTFSQRAGENVRDAVKELDDTIAGGMKGVVLDLRSNPGGLLDQAVDISDVFLSGGEIVSTRGRRPKDTLREMGKQGELLDGRPVVVLI